MPKKQYTPSQKILEKYADVLVNFALGGGKGIKKGDIVRINCGEFAKPLYVELHKAVIKAGGHVIANYYPNNDRKAFNPSRDFYEFANDSQLKFFPEKYMKALIETIDHNIHIIADIDKKSLEEIEPKKIMIREGAQKPMQDWFHDKESSGKLTWTVALYGTPAGAKEAGLDEKEYWKEIIRACFLDKPEPKKEWRKIKAQIEKYKEKLNSLRIESLRVTGKNSDLKITLGQKRRWASGIGNNIPSFEIFTSPDWRGTEGWIKFDQPLYRYGSLVEGIELEFKNGKIIKAKAKAKKNEKVLKEMIAVKNADKVGEFSLTDKRFSRIDKFMAETLFDENMGGPFGNTHIALGMSYKECYDGDPAKVKKSQWEKLGFNDSSVHTDIISTSDRTVTATLKGGEEKVIYKDGQFIL